MSNLYASIFSIKLLPKSIRWIIPLWVALLPLIGNAQTISGTVFRDYDTDGIKDTTEPLIGGIVVRIYNSTNTLSGTATSAVSLTGTTNYSITPTGSAPYRVEFTIPPASASACGVSNDLDFDAMVGTNSRTSIQFVSAVPATVSFGIANAHQYASPTLVNPKIFTSCYVSGNNLGTGNVGDMDAFIGVNYNPTNNTTPSTPAPAHYANTRQVGSTWGVAYSKQAKRVFTSAVLKRHTGLGPLGSGGIYMIDPSKQLPDLTGVVNFLNFDAIGIPTSTTGTYAGQSVAGPVVAFSPIIGTNAQRGLGLNTNSAEKDAQALAQSGRVSFGDLDISDDGRYLYVMNLFDRRLYEIDLTDAANPVAPTAANRTDKIRSWAIPEPCVSTQGIARPWGIDYYRGKPYIGVVCDAASSQNSANLNFTIYELDPTSGVFTAKFSNALNFPRGLSNGFDGNGNTRKGWFGWTDDWNKLVSGNFVAWPQPILSDIEFDTDGSMVLGFLDRTGLQGGWNNLGPITGNNTLYKAIIGGDLLRAYKRTDCQWELESAGKEGPSSPKPATGGATNGEGPGNGEFYYEEFYESQHRETGLGGLGILFGSGDVVSTIYDPFQYDSFGLGWFDNTTGKKDKGYEVFATGNNGSTPPSGTFSKGLSLGDVEIQNELPPIQIGNRVWNDLNNNGVQDAGEPALAGIPVILKGPGLPPAGTTVTTGSNGEYYFSNASGTNATGFVYSLTGLTSGGSYSLCFPLTSTTLTLSSKPNQAPGSNADQIDTDASAAGVISFTLGDAGENNFSYDAGYVSEPCALTLIATPGTCQSATNQYTVTGTINLTAAVAGTATITDGAQSTTVAITASSTAVAYSLTGLTSGTGSHTVTVTLTGCGTASTTYTAPASCTVAPCSLSAVATAGLCQTATNTYSLTVVTTLTNPVAGTLTVNVPGASSPITLPITATTTQATAVFDGLTSNGQSLSATVSLPGCGSATPGFTAPVSCSVAPICSLTVTPTAGVCNTSTNGYSATVVVRIANTNAGGTLTVTDGAISQTLAVGAGLSSFTGTAVFNNLPSDGSSHLVSASLAGCSSQTATYTAPVACSVAPCSLSITTASLPNGQVGTAYSQTITATNGTAPLTFTLSAGSLPAGLNLSAAGVILGTPTSATTSSFTVKVTDAQACSAIVPLTITTSAQPVCSLTATATPGVCNSAANTYTVTGTVSATNGPATQSLTISANGSSAVVTLTGNGPASYTLTGLTSDGLIKTVSVVSSASVCGTTSVTYAAPASCTVAPTRLAVVVTPVCNTVTNNYTGTGTVSLTNATAGTLTITDEGIAVGTISVTAGQTSATFTLTGVSGSAPPTHSVVATLNGVQASTTYATPASCTVCSLSITTASLPNGQVGVAYSQTITATGGTAPLTYTLSAGTLPAGLNLSAAGVILGTPTSATTSSFTVKVTDSKSCSAIVPLTITTSALPVCSLTATATPGVCNSATNTYTVTGTVSATNGPATQSLTISANGSSAVVTLTGNGPASYTLTGLTSDGLTKTVSVVSSASACGQTSVTYTAPASCSVAPCSLSVTTASLPNGQVGVAYSQTITATGGTAPLTYTLSAGTLPAGLNLSAAGVILGTPTSATTSSFTVKVTDSKSCSAIVPLTITTSALPVCSLTATATPGVCNSATNTYTVTGTVSATNGPATQSLTISANGSSAVVTLTGNGPASYTLTGLTSDGLTKTVSVVSSASACGQTSVTYTAPASCSAAPPLKASLGNYVWFDANNDGQQAGESGVQNVTVVLCDATSGSALSTTVTDANGGYLFSNLDPGTYRVKFTAPAGMTFTAANQGNDVFDSDVASLTGNTGSTGVYSLTAGQQDLTVDAGLTPLKPSIRTTKRVNKTKAKVGDVLSYTITVINTGPVAATSVVLSDSITSGLRLVPGSAVTSLGSFTTGSGGGTWTIASLPTNTTATLVYSASVLAEGVLTNSVRRRPLNPDDPGEEVTVCTSVPYLVCKNEPFSFELSAPAGYSRYQWFLTTPAGSTTLVSDVSSTTANTSPVTYTATQLGEYSLVVNEGVVGACPDGTCCPVIIEAVEVPSFSLVAQNPTCTATTPQANGQIRITNLTSGTANTAQYVYQISPGSSFSAATATPASPTAILPSGVVGTNLAQGSYTVRVWVLINGEPSCPRDVTVTLVANCACPEEICVPVTIRKTKSLGRTLP